MIRKKLAILAVCMLILTSFSGCAEMITLTSDEEEEIAIYISSLIGRYNRNQKKGLSYVSKLRQQQLIDEQLTEAGIIEETAPDFASEQDDETAGLSVDMLSVDEATGMYVDPITGNLIDPDTLAMYDAATHEPITDENGDPVLWNNGGNSAAEGSDGSDGDGAVTASGGASNISEVLPIEGASISYDGAQITTHYGTEYYDLAPTRGYEFLELTFTLTNTSGGSLDIDTTQYGLVFRATADGVTARSDQTILINDLKSYIGTLPAGESVELVLLFQYPSGRITDLSDLSLTAEYGGNTYNVIL